MAAIAPILGAYSATVLNDNIAGEDTSRNAIQTLKTGAAAQTLSPDGYDSQGVMRWVDRSGGIAIGYPAVTLSVRKPTKGSRIYKVVAKCVLPVLEQTSASTASGIQPAPTKAYDLTCNLDFLLPERSSRLERTALMSLVLTLLTQKIQDTAGANPVTTATPLFAAVLDFDKPWG